MNTSEFRTESEEVVKLLDECRELKTTLREISGKISRIESRIKRVFPISAAKAQEKAARRSFKTGNIFGPALSPLQAQELFDQAVLLATTNPAEAESFLSDKHPAELLAVAKEVGISFPKNKPSARILKEGIYGKIRESLLLSRHSHPIKREP